jgi:predicted exporter
MDKLQRKRLFRSYYALKLERMDAQKGGHQLTIFHLVGLLLVVGVGSNYTLFFERETFGRTDSPRTLVSLARAPVLSAIGTTVALGAFLSLLFTTILAGRARA